MQLSIEKQKAIGGLIALIRSETSCWGEMGPGQLSIMDVQALEVQLEELKKMLLESDRSGSTSI